MELALHFDLHACTDITGFGILGHLLEVAHGSDARIVVTYNALPFYPAALEMYKKGETTGSNNGNRAMVAKHHLQMSAKLTAAEEELLYDPQTSGGLLLSVPHDQANELMSQMQKDNIPATRIGEITDDPVGITVV